MASTPNPAFTLSDIDAFALARAIASLPIQQLPATPVGRLILCQLDLTHPDDLQLLRRLLGPALMRDVLSIDPTQEPSHTVTTSSDLDRVPDLPASAVLSDDRIAQGRHVGRWLDDYIAWAGSAANETPLSFHLAAGLYLAAIAVGRRLCLLTPWRQRVYPNLYIMLVAISTYYRKSAGLGLAAEVARLAVPHMLMPQPGSPENFMAMLGGILPPNFSDIPQPDRTRLEHGNRFAAQRGLLRDELSALFKSMGRDYMAGLKELIMTLYDCPDYLDSNNNQKGLVVIRDAALSILGAATPAELSHALSAADWHNGNLARFVLLTPEADYIERPVSTLHQPPTHLTPHLQALHQRLPEPPDHGEGDDADAEKDSSQGKTSAAWTLQTDIWPLVYRYEQALRAMTAPGSMLDDRLRATYGRLHVHALKVAILLAALDWSADTTQLPRPVVTPAHWYRAQMIAEQWRASAHRLLAELSESEEGRLEGRILALLKASGGDATVRDLYRALRSPRKPVAEALRALEQDGRVMRIQTPPRPGLQSETYRLTR